MELHSAAILLVCDRQSASWPRSSGGPPAVAAAVAASLAWAFLRRPMGKPRPPPTPLFLGVREL